MNKRQRDAEHQHEVMSTASGVSHVLQRCGIEAVAVPMSRVTHGTLWSANKLGHASFIRMR